MSSPDAATDGARARSPTTRSPTTGTVRTRPPLPHGPRGPKPASKSAMPLDMCNRLDEATPAYSSLRSSSAWSPSSSAFPLSHETWSDSGSSRSRRNTVSRAIQTSVGDTSAPPPPTSHTASPAVTLIKKNPTLRPPPPLNFDSVPVPWRGMTLEAAQWSLTSEQLQEISSTAIRVSAEESFIRLVPLQAFNGEMTEELERLESLKATTQAQYRFNMHRRMMLLQSLNALSFSPASDGSGAEALASLTAQLADITVACDRLMETLLMIADQRAQIQRLQDVHIASALAMALRKLNGSYSRRVQEVRDARQRIDQLQAELEDAWQAADELAQEMDALDSFEFDYEDEQYEDASAVVGETYTERSVQLAEVMGISGRAVAVEARYTNLPGGGQAQVADRASRVSAARRRSVRTSKASLRLPRSPLSPGLAEPSPTTLRRVRSRSKSRRRPSVNTGGEVPQVPTIQVDPGPFKGGSFLELAETRPASPASAPVEVPPSLPPLLTVNSQSKRQTLEVPILSPNPSLASPGFDRTIIPPLAMPGAKDDSYYPTERERQLSFRRVQSLQPRSRTDPFPETLTSALRRTHSDHRKPDWSNPEKLRSKAKRYSVPMRAASEVSPSGQEVTESRGRLSMRITSDTKT